MARLLNIEQLAKRLGKSTMTLYRWKRAGLLPEPAKLPGQDLRWDLTDIIKWEEAGYPRQGKRNKGKT